MSFRRDIRDHLVTRLGEIKVSNGYHNTVVKVSKKLKDIGKVTSTPELSVLLGPTSKRPTSEEEALYEVNVTFAVIGYIRAKMDTADDGALGDLADSLSEDVEECLLNDDTLISDTEAKSLKITSIEPDLDYEANVGYITVLLTVLYHHDSDT
jgi:hypothetical protein